MKRHLILSALLFALAVPGLAAKAPKGKAALAKNKAAATVTSVTGSPKLSKDGKDFKKAKVGQSLEVGTQIRTGKGKMVLLLSEGSTVRLIENTEITLKSHNPGEKDGGTVFKLVKGFGRFVVEKLAKGRHFKIETSNAVAAVKGTDAEEGVDDEGNTILKVHETNTGSSVDLTDPVSGETVNVGENEEVSFDGEEFREDAFTQEEQARSDQQFGELPPPPAEGEGQGEGGEQGQGQGGEGQAQAEGSGEGDGSGEGESAGGEGSGEEPYAEGSYEEAQQEFVEEIYEEFYQDLYLDDQQTLAEQSGDLENQRLVIDRRGYAALVGNRVSRPDAYSVQKEVLVFREFGPDAGYSGASEYTSFNQPLPLDWTSVYSLGVNDPANHNADGYPNYFRLIQTFYAFNPWGDYIYIDTVYDSPHFLGAGPGTVEQGFQQAYQVNGVGKGYLGYFADDHTPGGYTGSLGSYPTSAGGLDLNCYSCYDEYPYMASASGDGGVNFHFSHNVTQPFSNGDLFTMAFRFHDDEGLIQPIGVLPSTPAGLRGLGGNGYNLSLVFSAPEFEGREIDLIFLPGYFDAFEILTPQPAGFSSQGGA